MLTVVNLTLLNNSLKCSRGGGKKWNNNGPSGSRASSLQGSGSNNTSGHSSPVSPAPSSPSIADSRPNAAGSSEVDANSPHMHDRMLFLLANLVVSIVYGSYRPPHMDFRTDC